MDRRPAHLRTRRILVALVAAVLLTCTGWSAAAAGTEPAAGPTGDHLSVALDTASHHATLTPQHRHTPRTPVAVGAADVAAAPTAAGPDTRSGRGLAHRSQRSSRTLGAPDTRAPPV